MYWEPAEVKAKPGPKTDPTASARSAIRRQRTVRHRSLSRPHPSFQTASSHYRPTSSHGRPRIPAAGWGLLDEIRRQEEVAAVSDAPRRAYLEHARQRDGASVDFSTSSGNSDVPLLRIANMSPSGTNYLGRTETRRPVLESSSDIERSRERLQERMHGASLNIALATQNIARLRNRVPSHDVVAAARTAFLANGSATSDSETLYLTTAPEPSGSPSSQLPTRATMRSSTAMAPLSSRFTPAYRLSSPSLSSGPIWDNLVERLKALRDILTEEQAEDGMLTNRQLIDTALQHIQSMRDSPLTDEDSAEAFQEETRYFEEVHTYIEGLEEQTAIAGVAPHTQPLLSLTSRHSPGDDSQTQRRGQLRRRELDGLGDRERSFSPENDAWETLLQTIPYDERVPSAQSSFTSNSASMSASASASSRPSVTNTAASSQTTLFTGPVTSLSTDFEICPPPDSTEADIDPTSDDPYENGSRLLHTDDEMIPHIEALRRYSVNEPSTTSVQHSIQRRMLLRQMDWQNYQLSRMAEQQSGPGADEPSSAPAQGLTTNHAEMLRQLEEQNRRRFLQVRQAPEAAEAHRAAAAAESDAGFVSGDI